MFSKLVKHLCKTFRLLLCAILLLASISAGAQELPGTEKLSQPGDLALEMVAGIDRFAMRELEQSVTRRAQYWQQDFSSPERYAQSVAPNRHRFLQRIGAVDARMSNVWMELVSTTEQAALVGESKSFTVLAVRWQALEGVYGEGLLVQPRGPHGPRGQIKASVIALGDADHTPEMLVGLTPGLPPEAQFARKLAEQGCEVLLPVLIDRADTWAGNPRFRMTNQPHREFVYRMAYEMGRHVIGYEVQKVLAAAEYFKRSAKRVGVFGYGEGGLLALYSGAADARPDALIDAVGVSGYFLAALNIKALDLARTETPRAVRINFDPAPRQQRQFEQLLRYTQAMVRQSEFRRAEFLRELLTSPLDKRDAAEQRFRDYFHEEVIGRFPAATLPLNARSRKIYQQSRWTGYEVMLDVWPDVFAYGILLLPNNLQAGERRPVVVCQHGLEGRPQDLADPAVKSVYHSFAAQLAERGFIVFAPQNPYIGKDQFRVLQRKLNPLRKSLFSIIVRQHERILAWLAEQPFVDASRIGFYGLSYGGKTAMRVPALLPQYALSICSGDFNEWIVKNTTLDYANSYLFLGEYEMPEFNLGHTFNYAEMAALIAPRPFMVERGHHDIVGVDELVAYEYAKVRRMYADLGLPQNTRIEFFPSGHEIHGQGTFAFLHEHLRWPQL